MAVMNAVPHEVEGEVVSFKEASRLFAETDHPVSESTMRRWVQEQSLRATRIGKKDYYPFSDLLVEHAKWVARQAG
ncbi:hypothetical protein ACF06X_33530 [Streptomyces sp. NPDC015346]|uniref:hypothetical protein n=1 Tax=Streptomyces sp. NPDC015346 TaxID=3364954 RepID=UPI0036F930A9